MLIFELLWLQDRFDINLQEDHVRRCCDLILRHRTKDYRFRLHQRFTEALKTKSVEVVRRKPLANMSVEDWNMLIDIWTSPKWQVSKYIFIFSHPLIIR